MNRVILMGRLTRDPEITEPKNNKKNILIARFTLAVNRNKDDTDWIRCTAFGKTAEVVEQYLFKGSQIVLEGQWRTGQYQNDDETVYTNECIVDTFKFCDSRKKDEDEEDKPKRKTSKSNRGERK